MARSSTAAKTDGTDMALFSNNLPAYLKDTGNEGRGNEGVGIEDLSIPRIDVIQSLSPQRKKNDPAYIEGAEEGMLFNTVTGELYGTEAHFVPVMFRKEYVIWRKRDQGGGFRGSFPSINDAQAAKAELDDGDQCEIVDTAQHFSLLIKLGNDGNPVIEEVVLSMAKTKMKASRQLNTLAKLAGGDRFSRVYKLIAQEASNDKGDFYTFAIKQMGYAPEAVYRAAEGLYEQITSGLVDVNYSDATTSDDETISDEGF